MMCIDSINNWSETDQSGWVVEIEIFLFITP